MTIVIPPALEATLARRAQVLGVSLEDYVAGILARNIRGSVSMAREDLERIVTSETPESQAARAEAIDQLRQLRKGVTLGPTLTIRNLIDEGRRL